MEKKFKNGIYALIFVAGLSLLLYPFIADKWNDYRQQKLIISYEQVLEEQTSAGTIDYQTEWEKAKKYNDEDLPAILPDAFAVRAFAEEPDPNYIGCLNIAGDGLMGVVEIPKIGVKLPIYHTASEEVLMKAAGHLEGNSLPVGGESTHTVITAHRGLPNSAMFTDLDKVEEGDHILIHVLDDTLCYEVDMITVAEPTDLTALRIEDGKDYASLFTCTPYGVNSHRLMVRGHRVEYVEEAIEEEIATVGTIVSTHTSYFLWVIVGLSATAIFVSILFWREKKIRERIANKKQEE